MKKNGTYNKKDFLRAAAKLEGFYVPSLYDVSYNEDGTINTPALNEILSPCLASQEGTWSGQQLYVVAGGDGVTEFDNIEDAMTDYSEENEKMQNQLDMPMDDEYIENVASEKLGLKHNEWQYFYSDSPN